MVAGTPKTLPSEATLYPPVLPDLLPVGNIGASLLQPANSLGIFGINVNTALSAFGSSFAGFGLQQTPLSQSSFFNDPDQKHNTYNAGAKP
jgi:hypothetical protein